MKLQCVIGCIFTANRSAVLLEDEKLSNGTGIYVYFLKIGNQIVDIIGNADICIGDSPRLKIHTAANVGCEDARRFRHYIPDSVVPFTDGITEFIESVGIEGQPFSSLNRSQTVIRCTSLICDLQAVSVSGDYSHTIAAVYQS